MWQPENTAQTTKQQWVPLNRLHFYPKQQKVVVLTDDLSSLQALANNKLQIFTKLLHGLSSIKEVYIMIGI